MRSDTTKPSALIAEISRNDDKDEQCSFHYFPIVNSESANIFTPEMPPACWYQKWRNRILRRQGRLEAFPAFFNAFFGFYVVFYIGKVNEVDLWNILRTFVENETVSVRNIRDETISMRNSDST